jgi:beta-glucosidase
VSTELTNPAYLNPCLSPKERAADIVSRMTLEEKVSQMVNSAAPIPRLGVPAYDWWNECLHGVGRAGIATVFPQAIGLAATWDIELHNRIAVAISDEARAKHHEYVRTHNGDSDIYHGLTFWSPNINIFRDPRWGRGQETYGEDPYLTARFGVAFVKGLQGDDPRHLKLVATPKHFAVHSGPEKLRHGFDAKVSPRDLRETYLPAFEACVKEAKAASVMPAYNRTNGEACAASETLLRKILREEWGFQGYVVSDCGAIDDIYLHHGIVASKAEAAALAVSKGCDLNCGCTYHALSDAVKMGLIDEKTIDQAVTRLFEARMRLGMFDPPEEVAYSKITMSVVDSPEHRELALKSAQESIVLLKNEDDILPLGDEIKSVAVIGPNADNPEMLLGNYNGVPSHIVTPWEGIRLRAGKKTEVRYSAGCDLVGEDRSGFADALAKARKSDVTILFLGLSPRLEGEEGEEGLIDKGGDRMDITLPKIQEELLRAIYETGKPVILVVHSGSAVTIPYASENAKAILYAWYGGEEAGTALAQTLWGDCNPAGRLPITVYASMDQVPPFEDYSMHNRTYRYMSAKPLYRFGEGMSYTQFSYRDLTVTPETPQTGDMLTVSAKVKNIGDRVGDEVIQLYVKDIEASFPTPNLHLEGFKRIQLAPGEERAVEFNLHPRQLACYTDEGHPIVEPGDFILSLGGGQPDSGAPCVAKTIHLNGSPLTI